MEIEQTITIPISERIIKDRASAFFSNRGYKRIQKNEAIVYHRGSILGSIFSFTPIGWRVRAEVGVKPENGSTHVRLLLHIDTRGQIITQKERLFWKNEVEGLIIAIRTGNTLARGVFESASVAKAENVASAGLVISLAVLLAVVFRATYGTTLAGYLGGLIGTAVGFGVIIVVLKIRRVK
jgi:hypothetical protein